MKSPPETEQENNDNSTKCDRPLLEEDKNNSNDESSSLNINSTSVNSKGEESDNKINDDYSSDSIVSSSNSEGGSNDYNNCEQLCNNKSIEDNSHSVEENSASLWGANHFQPLTQLHDHIQSSPDEGLNDATKGEEESKVLEEIVATIKEVNGFQIALNSAIQSAYNRNEQVRTYLGDKLTQRENKSVKKLCLNIIRHPNIEVVKHKPQLVVRWSSL